MTLQTSCHDLLDRRKHASMCCLRVVVFLSLTTSSSLTSWYHHQGSCYRFSSHGSESFADKLSECQSYGASLVEVETSEEKDFVIDFITGSQHVGHQFWLGMERVSTDCLFQWRTSKDVVQFHIACSATNEQCARLKYTQDNNGVNYVIHDAHCARHPFLAICETPARSRSRSAATNTLNYKLVPGNVTSLPMSQGVKLWRSRIKCGAVCGQIEKCVGFEYDDVTVRCTLVMYDVMGTYVPEGKFYLFDFCDF